MQNVRPEALTDKELFHYAGAMNDRGEPLPSAWVDEMVRRYFSGKLQVPAPRHTD
jgi:hypothetical protein